MGCFPVLQVPVSIFFFKYLIRYLLAVVPFFKRQWGLIREREGWVVASWLREHPHSGALGESANLLGGGPDSNADRLQGSAVDWSCRRAGEGYRVRGAQPSWRLRNTNRHWHSGIPKST